MDNRGHKWIEFPKYTDVYISGVKAFIENAFSNLAVGNEIRCPCKHCKNDRWHCKDDVFDHLICDGPSPVYLNYIHEVSMVDFRSRMDQDMRIGYEENFDEMFHGAYRNLGNSDDGLSKGPNAVAKKLFRLVEEGKQPLYPGCVKYSRLSFLVRLYLLKCVHGISESAFGELLELIKEAFPEAQIPLSFNAAKNVIKDLGLDYEKIHACPNDCMLYWGENENDEVCKTCDESRWILIENKGYSDDKEKVKRKVPAKVMRYFPLKPRLQRLFMCREYSKLMTWHAFGRKKDGKLRHVADGEAWKTMDAKYPKFSSENRNVRLGVAADGFNPFSMTSLSHSTWPIILVNYNLPPWLIMKPENLMLSTLIPGPNDPGNNIDVYMKPLITELKELWDVGVETYDISTDHKFTLRASVLWTISDFPGYGMLSGWSTKGYLACPSCHYETSSQYLKHSRKVVYMNHRKFLDPNHKWRFNKKRFNGQIETGQPSVPLSGEEIEEILVDFENNFGKNQKKKKCNSDCPFKKKSIFFDLPYWRDNLSRHNLDVMHIEKNIFDSIIGTLLNIGGKTKDHVNARLDLQETGIRKDLHPIKSTDGNHFEIRAAIFDMTDTEKEMFCSVLRDAKLPHGCASNVSRYVHVKERKISGYKSHDAHFILQHLLQFAVKRTLKPEVAIPLIRLAAFFRGICSKVIDLEELKRLQNEIIEILCQFEMIFPEAYFDVMMHLPVHLCKEIEYGGPVNPRWMFGIERYLYKLKKYVRNRSKPEGSISEGYLAEECLTFCSRFLNEREKTTSTNCSTDAESSRQANVGYSIGTRRNKDGTIIQLDDSTWMQGHRYILFNCGNEEIESLIEEHRVLMDGHAKSKKYKRARLHTEEFYKWLKDEVKNKESLSRELSSLARGPTRTAKQFSGYAINGFRFHTRIRDDHCRTQNSGVFVSAMTTSFASAKDQNPIIGDVNYYGRIEKIIEFDYWGAFTAVLFRCSWYKEERDNYGFTVVNFSKLCQKSDPYVMASQVQQVFYIKDPVDNRLHYVIKNLPKEWCGISEEDNVIEDVNEHVLNDHIHTNYDFENQFTDHRDDVPTRQIPITTNEVDLAMETTEL